MLLYCGPFSRSTSDRRKQSINTVLYVIVKLEKEKNYDLTVVKTL